MAPSTKVFRRIFETHGRVAKASPAQISELMEAVRALYIKTADVSELRNSKESYRVFSALESIGFPRFWIEHGEDFPDTEI